MHLSVTTLSYHEMVLLFCLSFKWGVCWLHGLSITILRTASPVKWFFSY